MGFVVGIPYTVGAYDRKICAVLRLRVFTSRWRDMVERSAQPRMQHALAAHERAQEHHDVLHWEACDEAGHITTYIPIHSTW